MNDLFESACYEEALDVTADVRDSFLEVSARHSEALDALKVIREKTCSRILRPTGTEAMGSNWQLYRRVNL